MIDPNVLKSHLEDYGKVFGRRTDRFVCPITLRECEDSELINGHILNRKLRSASRRRVLQYSQLDHFYGTRVEPQLVEHLNMKELSAAELVRASDNLVVAFEDGTTAKAFAAQGKRGAAARRKYPSAELLIDGTPVEVFVVVDAGDSRLGGTVGLSGSGSMYPSHWVAAMLKASFLTMFDMYGYRTVDNALGEIIRLTLSRYFRDRASRARTTEYFHDFRNSIKILGRGSSPRDLWVDYRPIGFDSLSDRFILLHYKGAHQQLLFAATCIFRINDITVTATVPQSLDASDSVVAWKLYQQLMENERSVDQGVYVAQFKDTHWGIAKTPLRVHYVDDDESIRSTD